MLLIGTEGTDITRRVMHQAMPHHFIFALEPFPSQSSWTPFHGTEMRPILRVHIGMGAGSCGFTVRGLWPLDAYLTRGGHYHLLT